MSAPPASEPPPIGSQTTVSNAELESMRRHSIQVLGSVAAALDAAARQKQTLLAEVEAAKQTLQALASERENAELSLTASRSQLKQAATRLEQAELQRLGILREVEDLRSAGLLSRAALAAEIALLEGRRNELVKVIEGSRAGAVGPLAMHSQIARSAVQDAPAHEDPAAPTPTAPPDEMAAAQQHSMLADWRPRWTDVVGAARGTFERMVLVCPIHPGFGNVATAAFVVLFLTMTLLLSPLTQVIGGVQLLAVTSGSMAPGIPTGSVVAVRPVSVADLKVGDVITFANPSAPEVLVTHRVINVDVRDGQTMLTTKGDANGSADGLTAPASRAVGRVDLALPWLGDAMVWLGSPLAKLVSVLLALLALGLTVASGSRPALHALLVH